MEIIVNSDLNILSCGPISQSYWEIEPGDSLSKFFDDTIIESYLAHIKTASAEAYSFTDTEVFELSNSLQKDDTGNYRIRLKLPESILESIPKSRLKFLNELMTGASIQDRKGLILFHNQAAQRIYGLKDQDALGLSSNDKHWQVQNLDGKNLTVEDYPTIKAVKANAHLEKEVIAIYNTAKMNRIWLQIDCIPLRFEGLKIPHAVQCNFIEISERVQLDQDNRRIYKEEAFVFNLSKQLLSTKEANFRRKLHILVEEIGKQCQADACFILSLNEEQERLEPEIIWSQKNLHQERLSRILSVSWAEAEDLIRALKKNEEYKIDRISLESKPNGLLEKLQNEGLESLLYIPIPFGETNTAVLGIQRKIGGKTFKRSDQYLLRRAIELINSMRYSEESSQQLLSTANKLKRLSANINDVIWTVNLKLEAIYVSGSEQVLGISSDAFLQNTAKELIKSAQSSLLDIIEELKKKTNSQKSWSLKVPLKINGKLIPLAHHIRGELNDKQELIGLIISSRDESSLQEAFMRLENSEKKYRSLFEKSALGLVLIANEGIIDCNPRAAEMLGYSLDELKGKRIDALSPPFQPDGRPSGQTAINYVAKALKGQEMNFEWTHLKANGEEVNVRVHLNVIHYDNQDLVLASWRDISKDKNKDEELFRLNTAVENSPVSMVITNLDAEIEYVNPAVLKITGYTKEELIGKNPRILQSGQTPKNTYNELWGALTAQKEWHGVFHNKKKNGDLYWERVHISPITNSHGVITHYLAVKEDITLLKKYVEAIEKQNETLKEIAWTESHLLRAPLARLLGLIELFKSGDFSPDLSPEKVLQLMEDSALEIDKIIEEISKKSYQRRKEIEQLGGSPI